MERAKGSCAVFLQGERGAGGHDTGCGLGGNALAAQLPHCQLKRIKGANHLYPIEQPTAFANTLQDWLTSQSAAR